jgi:hypothetical protein
MRGADRTVAVSFSAPEGALVAGVTFEVDYPAVKIDLEGEGTGVPQRVLTDAPAGAVVGANDLGNMLRSTVARKDAMPEGVLLRLRFRACAGAVVPTAAELPCRIVGTSDPVGNPVAGVTCVARPEP